MIDTKALKSIIFDRGLSQRKIANQIGIAEKTFYTKMARGVFGSDEIEKMICILKIEDPVRIFFAKEVTR